MVEKIVKLFLQWEPNEPDSTDGQDHIYAKVIQSELPVVQIQKYLCGLSYTEEPTIDAAALEQMIDPGFRRQTLLKNMCPKCLEELDRRFPQGR